MTCDKRGVVDVASELLTMMNQRDCLNGGVTNRRHGGPALGSESGPASSSNGCPLTVRTWAPAPASDTAAEAQKCGPGTGARNPAPDTAPLTGYPTVGYPASGPTFCTKKRAPKEGPHLPPAARAGAKQKPLTKGRPNLPHTITPKVQQQADRASKNGSEPPSGNPASKSSTEGRKRVLDSLMSCSSGPNTSGPSGAGLWSKPRPEPNPGPAVLTEIPRSTNTGTSLQQQRVCEWPTQKYAQAAPQHMNNIKTRPAAHPSQP